MGSQKSTRWDQRRRGCAEVRQRLKAEVNGLNLKDERKTMYNRSLPLFYAGNSDDFVDLWYVGRTRVSGCM